MDEEFSVAVSLPLDSDGFLRRECPSCEQQFKWFSHDEGDSDAEIVDQYFCPLCGVPSGVDTWWTKEQIDYAEAFASPQIGQFVQDAVADAFKGIKGITYKADRGFSLGDSTPDPLVEPDDMVIIEPPCHPNEPVKVPESAAASLRCLICGTEFSS